MLVQRGLKESLRMSLAQGIRPDLRTVRKSNYSGIVMSVMVLFAVMCWLASCAHAEDVDMSVISMIESSGCIDKLSDKGEALGCYQMHKEVIKDYNQANKTKYDHIDILASYSIDYKIANWYMNIRIPQMLKHYKKSDTLENRLTAWNQGISAVIKGRKATAYINKYKKLKG